MKVKAPATLHPNCKFNTRFAGAQPSDFVFEEKLGKGGSGEVWRARLRSSNEVFALKKVMKQASSKQLSQLYKELSILYSVNHPHILKLYGHFEDSKFYYLVTEYAEHGTLLQRLQRIRFLFAPEAAKIFSELLSAVEHLHSHTPPIIHRDIKPENVLLGSNRRVVLADFGWSNVGDEPRNTLCGTWPYMPPEIATSKGHNEAVDLWCLGVLLYQIFVGKLPFKGAGRNETMTLILETQPKFPPNVPSEAQDLILQMLAKDQRDRISIQAIKQHPWLKNSLLATTVPPSSTLPLTFKECCVKTSFETLKTTCETELEDDQLEELVAKVQTLKKTRLFRRAFLSLVCESVQSLEKKIDNHALEGSPLGECFQHVQTLKQKYAQQQQLETALTEQVALCRSCYEVCKQKEDAKEVERKFLQQQLKQLKAKEFTSKVAFLEQKHALLLQKESLQQQLDLDPVHILTQLKECVATLDRSIEFPMKLQQRQLEAARKANTSDTLAQNHQQRKVQVETAGKGQFQKILAAKEEEIRKMTYYRMRPTERFEPLSRMVQRDYALEDGLKHQKRRYNVKYIQHLQQELYSRTEHIEELRAQHIVYQLKIEEMEGVLKLARRQLERIQQKL